MEEISYRTNAQYTGGSLYCVFVFSQVIFRAYVTRIQRQWPTWPTRTSCRSAPQCYSWLRARPMSWKLARKSSHMMPS